MIKVTTLGVLLAILATTFVAVDSASSTAEACERNTVSINCDKGLINVIKANYGRLSRTVCTNNGNAPINNINCISTNSLDIMKAQCSNKSSCSVQANNGVFGDPCVGTYKHLQVEYECVENNKLTKTAFACEGSNLDISCDQGETIRTLGANYGRTSNEVCSNGANTQCKSPNSFGIVYQKCTGEQRCTVSANNGVFGDPCVGTYKYLEVVYVCVKRRNCRDLIF